MITPVCTPEDAAARYWAALDNLKIDSCAMLAGFVRIFGEAVMDKALEPFIEQDIKRARMN